MWLLVVGCSFFFFRRWFIFFIFLVVSDWIFVGNLNGLFKEIFIEVRGKFSIYFFLS